MLLPRVEALLPPTSHITLNQRIDYMQLQHLEKNPKQVIVKTKNLFALTFMTTFCWLIKDTALMRTGLFIHSYSIYMMASEFHQPWF